MCRLGPSGSLICPKTHTRSTLALSCVCGGEGLGYLFVGVSGGSKVHQSRIPMALLPLPTITLCAVAPQILMHPLNSPGSVWLDGRGPGCGLSGLGLHPVGPLACVPLGDFLGLPVLIWE